MKGVKKNRGFLFFLIPFCITRDKTQPLIGGYGNALLTIPLNYKDNLLAYNV